MRDSTKPLMQKKKPQRSLCSWIQQHLYVETDIPYNRCM